MKLFNPMIMDSLPRMKIWIGLFIAGIVAGVVAYDTITPLLTPLFEITYAIVGNISFKEINKIVTILAIFAKNALIALLCILTARLTFGIYPGLIVALNGLLIGYVGVMLVSGGGLTALQVFGGIAPHGVLELFGIFLACAIGFAKYPMKEKFRYSALVWIALFGAAVIEATITVMVVAMY